MQRHIEVVATYFDQKLNAILGVARLVALHCRIQSLDTLTEALELELSIRRQDEHLPVQPSLGAQADAHPA